MQFDELVAPEWMNHGGVDGYEVAARLPPATTKEQFREMLQLMLAKRFMLSVHWDHKRYPEYALRRGKMDPKVNRVTGILDAFVTGPVVDETALAENYDFILDFMLDDRWRGFAYMPKPADGSTPNAPSLEVAIKQQLGLVLEKRDGSLRVLVEDKAQKSPGEN